jgi:FixJ family two-component response regulator
MGKRTGTIYVVDDDASVRQGLTRLLESADWAVEAFASAAEFLDEVRSEALGCILLDVSMPDMTGPELHERLRASGYTLPVIYLSGRGTVAIGVHAMRVGAYDFLEKPVDDAALLAAIEDAMARYEQVRNRESHLHDVRQRLARLSPREREVMDQVILGRLNKQIASDLDIGVKTVKVHRGRVMSKMRVHSVAELVHLCDELGLGRLEPTETA